LQPSEPQFLPLHCLVQQALLRQTSVAVLQPQSIAQLLQFSWGAWHPLTPHLTSVMHLPVASQILPEAHVPQVLPQVSSPHSLPEHCGVQHLPAVVHFWPVVQAQSLAQLLQSSPVWQPFWPHTRSALHTPLTQDEPEAQGAEPHVPPHPSLPQVLPVQLGVQHMEL